MSTAAPLLERLARSGDVGQILREDFAGLDEQSRARVVAECAAARAPVSRERSERLHRIREALRRRSPSREDELRCEGIVSAGDSCYGIWGFAVEGASGSRLVAISPEGLRIDLKPSRYAHPHADSIRSRTTPTRRSGFFCCFDAPPSAMIDGWLVELENPGGEVLEARAPLVIAEPELVTQAVLAQLALGNADLLESDIHPILSRVQTRLMASARAADVREFGARRSNAEVSIVIPVFERPDLIEQQLAAFATDASLNNLAQIIFVLDSPWMSDQFVSLGSEWFDHYRVPFRLVALESRSGFAAACRAGVEQATAPSILFMHSDVLPASAGWLAALLDHQRRNPSAGGIGCQLLASDGSIQHRGSALSRRGESWGARSTMKGLNPQLIPNQAPERVDAVSGACLLIDRALFNELGRFSGEYVGGQNEDVDLCVRLASSGRTNWLLPNVSLHHLEGQSRSRLLVDSAAGYNAWLFNRRCGGMLNARSREGGVA